MDRKRRGGPLEGIPESKRPTARAGNATARAGSATGRAGGAGRAGAAAAAAAAEAAAPKPEETWDDIVERTGLSADDVLNRCFPALRGRVCIPGCFAALLAPAGPLQQHVCVRLLPPRALLLLLRRKLTFKKGTLPQKKLDEMGPVIKELKCVCCCAAVLCA
jgi:hypothetical protein